MKYDMEYSEFNLERVKSLETSLRKQLRVVVDISSAINRETQEKSQDLHDAFLLLMMSTSVAIESNRIIILTLREVVAGILHISPEGRVALTSDLNKLQELVCGCESDAQTLVETCISFANEVTVLGEMLNKDIENTIKERKLQIDTVPQEEQGHLQTQLKEAKDLQWQIGKLRMDVIALEVVELSQEWHAFQQLHKQIIPIILTIRSVVNDSPYDSQRLENKLASAQNWLETCSLVL
ncbi:hypothetical protein QCA50_013598 [Cerrena zonata]|uniref:Uncharacterized protein n=1 Tax=Cerrena zonata TaxID=2478898 RepID=A0AAW0FR45_9APHY